MERGRKKKFRINYIYNYIIIRYDLARVNSGSQGAPLNKVLYLYHERFAAPVCGSLMIKIAWTIGLLFKFGWFPLIDTPSPTGSLTSRLLSPRRRSALTLQTWQLAPGPCLRNPILTNGTVHVVHTHQLKRCWLMVPLVPVGVRCQWTSRHTTIG